MLAADAPPADATPRKQSHDADLPTSYPPTSDSGMPVSAPAPRLVSRVERQAAPIWRETAARRLHPAETAGRADVGRGRVVAVLLGVAVAGLDPVVGQDIAVPLAIIVITGIALIPGYLNIQLLGSILFDRPRTLRYDLDFPRVTLMIAAYNEEDSIVETLDYVLQTDYPGQFELVVADALDRSDP